MLTLYNKKTILPQLDFKINPRYNLNLEKSFKNLMPLLNWLLDALPSFPEIHLSEFELLKLESLKLSLNALRALQIPSFLRSPEEKIQIELVDFYQAIAQHPFPNSQMKFIEWLEDDVFTQDFNRQKCLALLWSEIIETFLWQTEFIDTPIENDIHFQMFKIGIALFYQPESFAGLLLAFCKQGYPIEKLICSGIIQDYHQYHIINIETLQRPFHILKSLSDNIPPLMNYLERFSKTHCGLSEFPQISLDGSHSNVPIQSVEITPFIGKINQLDMLQQFLNIFDIDFIFILTYHLQQFDKNCINQFLDRWIASQNIEHLKHIFTKIVNQLHPSMHFSVFNMIGRHIPLTLCIDLFENNPHLFWILLCTCPQIKEAYTKNALIELVKMQTFDATQIRFILELCKQKKFISLHTSWILKIIEFYVFQPDLELTHDEIIIIRSNSSSSKKCEMIAQKLHQELKNLIAIKISPMTSSTFVDIADEFLHQRRIITKIEQLGYKCKNNLKDHYDLTSMILSELLKNHTMEDVLQSLDIIAERHRNIEENHLKYKIRIIHELFKRSLTKNNERQILQCIKLLIFDFHIPFEKIIEELDEHGLSLIHLASKHAEAMSLYLQLTPAEFHIKILTTRDEHHKSLIDIAFTNPALLNIIVEELSSEHLFTLLSSEHKKIDSWWHLTAQYPEILSKLLNKLSLEYKNSLLLKRNKFDQNIIHVSMSYIGSIEVIFLHASRVIKLQLYQQKSFYNETILELAIQYPDAYLILLKHLHSDDLLTLLTPNLEYNPIFEKLLHHPEILSQTLTRLTQERSFLLTKSFLKTIVTNHVHQKDTIKIIFDHCTDEQVYQLLETPINDSLFIYYLLKYPETFAVAYEAILPKHRLFTISQFQLLDKLGKSQISIINTLMKGISPYETLNFFKLIIRSHPKWIEHICTDQTFIDQMLLFIPSSKLWEILSLTNMQQDSFLKTLPVNNVEILFKIITSIPMSARLNAMIYHHESEKSLIERASFYPESLDCLLQSIHEDERERLISLPFIQSMLTRCPQFESIMVFMNALPAEHHRTLLSLVHRNFQNVLHGFFKNPKLLLTMINMTHYETLTWICEKIQFQQIYLSAIYRQPRVLIDFFKSLPNRLLTQALLGLCYHYPNENISRDIKELLLEYYHPGSPASRRWFIDTYPNIHTSIRHQISVARTYQEWIEILESNIKEINAMPTRQLTV